MGVLGKAEWKQRKPRHHEFDVDGLGRVRIQPMMQADYMSARAIFKTSEGLEEGDEAERRGIDVIFPTLIAMAVVDDADKRVFDGPSDDAIKALEFAHLMQIGSEIQEFWGLNEVAQPATVKN